MYVHLGITPIMQSWKKRILWLFFPPPFPLWMGSIKCGHLGKLLLQALLLVSDIVVMHYIFKGFQCKSVNHFLKYLPTSESLRHWSVLCYFSSHPLLLRCFLPFCQGCAIVLGEKDLIKLSIILNKSSVSFILIHTWLCGFS